jgi:hypothetical protein
MYTRRNFAALSFCESTLFSMPLSGPPSALVGGPPLKAARATGTGAAPNDGDEKAIMLSNAGVLRELEIFLS